MKSPYGQRGAICAYLHWDWDYLNKGIAWATVQRIMADQEQYDDEAGKDDDETIELTEDNADQFINYINNMTYGE